VIGLGAVTRNDAGKEVVPGSPTDWTDWVSASRTRNWVLDDPLLDWLRLYGSARGFQRDDELPGYDERCDFTRFVIRQGRRFEEVVVAHLADRTRVVTIAPRGVEDIVDLAKAVETFEAMREGVPVIHQGVLRDPEHRVYGAPDLLVRTPGRPSVSKGAPMQTCMQNCLPLPDPCGTMGLIVGAQRPGLGEATNVTR
jgi:hypothetical protein